MLAGEGEGYFRDHYFLLTVLDYDRILTFEVSEYSK
jgi:hypothetical protein